VALVSALALTAGCASTSSQQGGGPEEATKRSGIYLDLGVAYLQQGNPRKALRTLKKARDLDDEDGRVYNALALTYQALGFDDKAEAAFEEAVDLNPKDPQIRNNYGVFLAKMGAYGRARTQFEKALADPLYNTPETAYYNLGWLAKRKGDAEEAEGMLRTALRLRPDYPPARLTLVQLLREEGELDQAGKEMTKLLERHPEHVQGRLLAGELALARQKPEAARGHLDKVVELAPDSSAAERSRSLLQRMDKADAGRQ
jgi:type IV pilus assembly protein PilF